MGDTPPFSQQCAKWGEDHRVPSGVPRQVQPDGPTDTQDN